MATGLALMFDAQANRPKGGRANDGPSTAALLIGAGALVVMLPFIVLDLEAPFLARESFFVADGRLRTPLIRPSSSPSPS